jgi:hypothetical protein
METFRRTFLISEDRIPRRQLLRVFEGLVTPLLLAACAILVITLPFSFPSTTLPVVVWLILTGGYSFLLYRLSKRAQRYPLSKRFQLFSQEMFVLHSAVGVAWLWLLQVFVWFMGYGHGGSDPHALWMLYILPLMMVSRLGTSRQWWWILAGVSGTRADK